MCVNHIKRMNCNKSNELKEMWMKEALLYFLGHVSLPYSSKLFFSHSFVTNELD